MNELTANATLYAEVTAAAASLTDVGQITDVTAIYSLIATLPSDAASFLSSLVSEEIVIASSVLNNKDLTGSSGANLHLMFRCEVLTDSLCVGATTTSTSTETGSTGGSTTTSHTTVAAQSTNAAATGGTVKVAGVAAGLFMGAVAML